MRVAIMADNADNFVKPRAEGLKRMLSKLNIESKVFYNGLHFLDHQIIKKPFEWSSPKSLARSVYHRVYSKEGRAFKNFWKELGTFDVMVVVETIPTAFLRYHLSRIEEFRLVYPHIPVVLYSSIYLGTLGEWIGFLKRGGDYHNFIKGSNHFGLERYDWYLIGSATTDFPLAKGFQPLSVIGCDLDDGSLYPEQNGKFSALVDFERPNHMYERAIQIMALEKTKTPYTVLHGRYPMAEIRKIYRSSAIYFIAHLEAFGLPIVETQASGCLVFSPYSKWCWAHYHKPDLTIPGEGPLSPNFKIYHNQLDTLCELIEDAKQSFDPEHVVKTFKEWDGHFFTGNMEALKDFVDKVKNGTITSKVHQTLLPLNDLIVEKI